MNQKSCTHYDNNLQIYAYCCKKFFDCKHCHNEKTDHKFVYDDDNTVKCINCNSEHHTLYNDNNNRLTHCTECMINFGSYHCNRCIIWCNKNSMYHCDKCRSCKIGIQSNNYHCDGCNMCLSNSCKNNHNCKIIDNSGDCPICLNKLNFISYKMSLLNCSHIIHANCLESLIENTDKDKKIPNCLLCKKSVVKFDTYETKFDNYCRESYDEYYKNWTNEIVCNDCLQKSTVKYNKIYNKCKNDNCRSYNTTILNTIKK